MQIVLMQCLQVLELLVLLVHVAVSVLAGAGVRVLIADRFVAVAALGGAGSYGNGAGPFSYWGILGLMLVLLVLLQAVLMLVQQVLVQIVLMQWLQVLELLVLSVHVAMIVLGGIGVGASITNCAAAVAALGGAGACGRGAASQIMLYKSYFSSIKANTALYRVRCLRTKEHVFVFLRADKLFVLG